VNWRAAAKPLAGHPLSDDPWPLAAKKLLTEREQSLYLSLLSLYPDHRVFIQVALSQLIDVPENHPDRQSIRNRFSQLVADFVLCRADLSLVAVIELDDRSHKRPDRQDADARKNKALADAGMRLVRIPAGRLPSEDALRAVIDADGRLKDSPREETVLSLAEDTYPPASSYDSDDSNAVSRELKRAALKVLVAAILLGCGWIIFSQVLPTAIKQAFQPLANTQVRRASSARQPSFSVISPEKKGQLQGAAVLQKQKDVAWAAFYAAPTACEHPADWNAQVECGNQYMRAKKLFEQRWAAEHPSSQVSGADGISIGGPHK
jgi:hypothetical protein